jgi:hypothetical protein
MPVSEIDGKLILHHPLPDNSVIPSFAVEQIGLWAMVAFKDPKKWIGKACEGRWNIGSLFQVRTSTAPARTSLSDR